MKNKKLFYTFLLILAGCGVILFAISQKNVLMCVLQRKTLEEKWAEQTILAYIEAKKLDIHPCTDKYNSLLKGIMLGDVLELTKPPSAYIKNDVESQYILEYASKNFHIPKAMQSSFGTELPVFEARTPTPLEVQTSSTLTVASITPSSMPTEIILPTKTPRPTLSVKEVEARVQQLMKDNGGCSLPCWWGIIPGETSWDDARDFLQTINPTFDGASNTSHYSFTYQIDSPGYPISAEFDVDDVGIVKKISVSQTAFPLNLAEFLVMVGKPDRVFLQVYPFTTDGVPPLVILLVYKDLHLIAQFVTGATLRENTVVGCPNQSKPSLILYAPSTDVSDELDKKFELERSLGKATPYKLLEESTKMDIDSFYHVFQNSNANNCIETPAEQWKVKQ